MIYHIGIIDYLQSWTLFKKTENIIKTIFKNPEKAKTISCVPPKFY